MNSQWDLSPIYSGFDDPAFERDLNDLQFRIGDFAALCGELKTMQPREGLRRGIALLETITPDRLTYPE